MAAIHALGVLRTTHLSLSKRQTNLLRALHKCASSEALRGTAAGEESLPPPGLTPPGTLEDTSRVKTLKEMPGPSTFGNLVEFFYRDGFSRIHEIQMEHRQKYGKIFKSRFGPQLVVSIADRDLVAQVLRAEGPTPQRANMESWKEYRDMRGRSTALISAEGEEWLKMRSVLRQLVMRPRDVAVFSEDMNLVVDDLIRRLLSLRGQASDGESVLNINDLFFKYAMEGVAAILYECRLGCLEEVVPKETQDYISALHLMFSSFKTTMYAGAIPRWLRPVLPGPWEDFCRSWDGLFNFSQVHVGRRLAEVKGQTERGEQVRGGLLTHMLVTMEMSLEDIYANATEMLLAVYMLALNEEVQQEISEEVVEVLGEEVPTAHHLPRLPLVRGLVKETLRPLLPLSPPPPWTQLALCHYATSLEEENFPDAGGFRPARWVRGGGHAGPRDNFGSLPFGYGLRSCIGRRIAELEMHLALARLIQRFHIDVSPLLSSEVKAKTHGLLCPGAPVHIRFRDRLPRDKDSLETDPLETETD
ncbi:hypothetical protein NHX12_006488 [Muraenolepis orangiensis]|uniref:Cytochrome P450 n=1 Tax=Muraenolepis orangiensis TaxID=630683 RepID=A0A9Q0DTF2_9TELE|nr:hypothetical protein NHX12_006488 [Muraenolepis orangiensis]